MTKPRPRILTIASCSLTATDGKSREFTWLVIPMVVGRYRRERWATRTLRRQWLELHRN